MKEQEKGTQKGTNVLSGEYLEQSLCQSEMKGLVSKNKQRKGL